MPKRIQPASSLRPFEQLALEGLIQPLSAKDMDRRIRKTRSRLQAGLLILMKEKPVSQISMREICRLVDIGRSTPYSHYRDVEDILDQLKAAFSEELQALLAGMPAGGDIAALRAWLLELFAFSRRNALFLNAIILGDQEPDFRSEAIAQCEAALRPRFPGPEGKWYASFLCGAVLALLRGWIDNDCWENDQEMADMTFRFLPIQEEEEKAEAEA